MNNRPNVHFPMKRLRRGGMTLPFILLIFLFSACNNENKPSQNGQDNSEIQDTSSIEYKIQRLTLEIEVSPDNYQLYYDRSLLKYQAGNTQGAIEDIDKSINRFVQGPEPYHLRGFYAYVMNDYEKAMLYFKRAAEQGSDDPETYYSLGQIYFFQGDYEEAGKWYNTALELDSLEPTYSFAQGVMSEKQGNMDDAVAKYQESLSKDPAFTKSMARLYELYLNHYKDVQAAKSINERILKVDSLHPVGRFNEGTFYFTMADQISDAKRNQEFEMLLKLAIAEYSKAVYSDPKYSLAYYNRGYCFFLLDKSNEALTDFDKVLELDPYNEKAYFMRGSIHEFYGDLGSALENYQEAARIDPAFSEANKAVEELTKKLATGRKE